jgi:multiple sugar transport system permease protein
MFFSGGTVPTYLVVRNMGLMNTLWALILPGAVSAYNVFVYRAFYKGISLEIREAARIDGLGEFRTFNLISMPLLKPAVATQAIFLFIASWNNLFMPTMILSSPKRYTLPMFVQILRTEQFRSDYGVIYVGLLLTVLPLLVVYLLLSRYIIAGVALGGVKE